MGYATLQECVLDLEKNGQLKRIDEPFDPNLELAYIQRRAFANGSPALLFTRPKGSRFPMLANLYGSKERVNFIFRDTLEKTKKIIAANANPRGILKNLPDYFDCIPSILHMRPKFISAARARVLQKTCSLQDLPRLVSWPQDGGPFITLPLVYSEDPTDASRRNLGMYRVQLAGNSYTDNEVGLHYQLQRGIGVHHAKALQMGIDFEVNIHVGGPPALTLCAVMPMPESVSELVLAGILGGRRVDLANVSGLPVLAQCDFVLRGRVCKALKPEGPFGDHLGYYSLRHDFPAVQITSVHHAENAIWPFTSVGRPPQEDTVFGDVIHELTAPMVGNVFEGISQVHAVDAAGVHPLLLAIGSERYTPYENRGKPRELLTQAMHLLGTTQTALAKFVFLLAKEDAPDTGCKNVQAFFQHVLQRTDFSRDLHFFTRSACDTLDYSGYALHEGSRLIWTCAGQSRRELGKELREFVELPEGFRNPRLVMPGVIVVEGPAHQGSPLEQDSRLDALAQIFKYWASREQFPLVVVVDDSQFCSASFDNFLWVTFTRTDPARDIYGFKAETNIKHWQCQAPLLMDARLKSFQAQPLEDDPNIIKRIEARAVKGGPLAGLI